MTWISEMQAVRDEAGGLVDVALVRKADLEPLMLEMLRGNQRSSRLFVGAIDAMQGINRAPKRRRMLCATCPRELPGPGYTIALAVPVRDDPSKHIAFAICHVCGTSQEELRPRVIEALNGVFAETRSVTFTHQEGGRA